MTALLFRALLALALLVTGASDCAHALLESNSDNAPSAQPGWQPSQPTPTPAPSSRSPPPARAGARRLAIADAQEAAEVDRTLDLIERGGPFPHRQDGTVFGNREGRLPARPYGYYREYTVRTPGAFTRGARRIVRGASGETYYTSDHYGSFVPIDPTRY